MSLAPWGLWGRWFGMEEGGHHRIGLVGGGQLLRNDCERALATGCATLFMDCPSTHGGGFLEVGSVPKCLNNFCSRFCNNLH